MNALLSVVSCSPDAIDHRDANILDGPEQVLVGDEISPDGAAVGATDVLREMVQEHGIHPAQEISR